MKSIHKLSLLIYAFIYIILVQNINSITPEPNPVKLIHVKAPAHSNEKAVIEPGYIAEPPIDTDDHMRLHLDEFRNNAKKLCSAYPDSAFTFLPTTNNIVALTFDDGPDPHITPKILDILEEYSITAAFFAIGENVQKYPEVVKRIVNSGHQLANHSWSHQRPTSIAASDLMDDVKKTQKILEEQYTCTRLFRPPYGLVTPEQMQQLTLHGYKAVIWSVDSMDWYTTTALEIQKCVLDKVHPGAIILMHCAGNQRNRQATIQALPGIIQDLKKRGYMFVTPDEILNS